MRWLLPVLAKLSLLTKRIHGLPILRRHLGAAAARTYLLDICC